MKATELRIGNIVALGVSNVEIKGIHTQTIVRPDGKDQAHFYVKGFGSMNYYPVNELDIAPIKLTEGFLEKIGATKHDSFNYKLMVGALPMFFRIVLGKCYTDLGDIYIGQHLEYVHQVQNLYFLLTGNELNIPS